MNPGKLELDKLVQRFEVHNKSDGKSNWTVEWYNEVLGLFLDWLTAEGMSAHISL